jgi:hypothetical protein
MEWKLQAVKLKQAGDLLPLYRNGDLVAHALGSWPYLPVNCWQRWLLDWDDSTVNNFFGYHRCKR